MNPNDVTPTGNGHSDPERVVREAIDQWRTGLDAAGDDAGPSMPAFILAALAEHDYVLVKRNKHMPITKHRCLCGWEGDHMTVHMTDVQMAEARS